MRQDRHSQAWVDEDGVGCRVGIVVRKALAAHPLDVTVSEGDVQTAVVRVAGAVRSGRIHGHAVGKTAAAGGVFGEPDEPSSLTEDEHADGVLDRRVLDAGASPEVGAAPLVPAVAGEGVPVSGRRRTLDQLVVLHVGVDVVVVVDVLVVPATGVVRVAVGVGGEEELPVIVRGVHDGAEGQLLQVR